MKAPPIPAVVIGLGVGASGVRASAATPAGEVLAEAQAPIVDSRYGRSVHEQDPDEWWSRACMSLRGVLVELNFKTSSAFASGNCRGLNSRSTLAC